ncbi:MAG: hypothetical protein GWN11_08650, partial [Candidatus Dadabacteria bacterium]|nr:hypothetical protein [Candidatus Dadabacteria bacterium]
MNQHIKYAVLTMLFVIPVLSCGNADNNDIKKVLSDRQTAFETKDLQLYLTCISPDYSQKVGDSVVGIEELSKNFQTNTTVFDTLKITRKDISIYMKGQGIAEVYQKSLFNLKIESQSSKFKTV